ncbi:hypothetical protein RFI_14350 [Reticulomyxa filosa]|uniref:Uncharacterized protein n=1 Tax=Reticulomyxa filosa TaxID=46433 RepID=X6NAB7_RETFI|nr:hypothetical protein RFI_14350 [Reticulomyxa filosa]|eukprot:ETO22843.1 hypothetical protein RFI_14350 [Reticulomyxa filosa]
MSDEKEDAKVIEFLEEPLDQITKEGEKKLYFKRSASDFRVSDYQNYDQNHEIVKTRSLIAEAVLGFNILSQTEDQKTENLAHLEKRVQEYEKTFKEEFSNYPVHVRFGFCGCQGVEPEKICAHWRFINQMMNAVELLCAKIYDYNYFCRVVKNAMVLTANFDDED